MSKSKITGIKKLVLNVKLRYPTGVTLNGNEAAYVIDSWQNESKAIANKRSDLKDVAYDIDRRLQALPKELETVSGELRTAKANFKQSKDPIVKRKWAKRVVLLSKYHAYVRGSHQTLTATVERVKDAIEEAQIVQNIVQNRIKDAQIYRDLNGGLQLVGKALVEARSKHMLPEIEYQNLEFTMEQLDKELSGDQSKLLIEAEAIVKQTDESSK